MVVSFGQEPAIEWSAACGVVFPSFGPGAWSSDQLVSSALHVWRLLVQSNSSHTFWCDVPKLQEGETIKTHIFVLTSRDEIGKARDPLQSFSCAWAHALILAFAALWGCLITSSQSYSWAVHLPLFNKKSSVLQLCRGTEQVRYYRDQIYFA